MTSKTSGLSPWRPEYGYRRKSGWRQKILYGDVWNYPRTNESVPPTIRLIVSTRRRWRTLFFIRSLGLQIAGLKGRNVTYIDVDIPPAFTADKLRRFVDHCRRSGIADERLGLPSVWLQRFSVDRTRASG